MQHPSSAPSSGDAIRQAVLHGPDAPASPTPNAPQLAQDANQVELDAQQVQLDAQQLKLSLEQSGQNATPINQEVNQIELDAERAALDAKQIALNANQIEPMNPDPTPPSVQPSTSDGQVTSLVTSLAGRLPAQVQLFQDASQQIQTLQTQATELPVTIPVTPVLLSVNTPPPQLSPEMTSALILFQRSMQNTQQALQTAYEIIDMYTPTLIQSAIQHTALPNATSLQVQAKLAEQQGKAGLALGNLASEVALTPPSSPSAQGVAKANDTTSDILSGINQGLSIVQTLVPLFEIIASLF